MARGRRQAQTCDGIAPCSDEVLEVLADRMRVAEIMMLGDQRLDERFVRRAADLSHFDRTNLGQRRSQGYGSYVDVRNDRMPAWLLGDPLRRRQGHQTGSVQLQKQSSALRVAQNAIVLSPAPDFADLDGDRSASGSWMRVDDLPDARHVTGVNFATMVPEDGLHASRCKAARVRRQGVRAIFF